MEGTIESFVAKLQADGVKAGRKEAERIVAEARTKAKKLVSDAEAEAKSIREKAEVDAGQSLARAKTELELAVRDTVARLRAQLAAIVKTVLAAGARERLRDPEFLTKLLHQLITDHNRQQLEPKAALAINVPREQHEQLLKWALGLIAAERQQGRPMQLDLLGELETAGFAFKVRGATVEVTLDSVVGVLCEMVAPELRALVDGAMRERAADAPEAADQDPKPAGEAKASG